MILKAHCQNKNYQLCNELLTSALGYALPNRSLVAIVTVFGRYLALGVVSALKKVVRYRQIISKRQMILFSHVRQQLHSHIYKKQVMTEVIS